MKHIPFSIKDPDQCRAFALLVRNLNEVGVPYIIRNEPGISQVEIEITEGY